MSQNTYASLDVLPSSKSAMGLGVQILGIHCTSDLVAPPIIYFISESKESLSKGFSLRDTRVSHYAIRARGVKQALSEE